MSEVREDLRYTKSHEWVKLEGDTATIGITDYAQHELTDIVFVELPKVGDTFEQEDEFGVVESVKSVSELYAPIAGEVVAVNEQLEDAPELINESPFDDGWIMKLRLDDDGKQQVEALLKPDAYLKVSEGS